MPLPAALAAKLAKRGLISAGQAEQVAAADEEVFAEDYDDQKSAPKRGSHTSFGGNNDLQDDIMRRIKGHAGCPNKYNIYHECTNYCVEHYKKGIETPDANYLLRKAVMLMQFPIPEGWQEEYDPGTGRFYYWNAATDLVSWYPPGHPKHTPSEAACVLREDVKLAESDEEMGSGSEDDEEEQETNEADEEDEVNVSEKRTRQYATNYAKGRNKKRENDLDPMDPASYSEIPRGTWSSGLMADTKTGVDSTASGPLYQQRPLPSPGAILRAKQKKK